MILMSFLDAKIEGKRGANHRKGQAGVVRESRGEINKTKKNKVTKGKGTRERERSLGSLVSLRNPLKSQFLSTL
jgi:hypothetical protein